MTRVALLTPTYWPEVRRGTERFAHELGVGLTQRGDDVTIVTSHKGRPATTTEDGLRVIRNWRPPDGRLRRRMFEDYLTHVPFAYLSLRRGDYDVANALFPSDGVAAARWSRETGKPAVLSYMGIPDRRGLVDRRWRIRITQDAIAGAQAVVALSKAAQDAFARWLGVQARQIYPPVDVETFTPGGQRAPEPTIICAGDLGEPRKRVPLLIEAFARVRRERPTARLLLDRPRDPAVAARVVGDAPGVDLVDIDDRIALRDAYRRDLGLGAAQLRRGVRARAGRGHGLRHAGRVRAGGRDAGDRGLRSGRADLRRGRAAGGRARPARGAGAGRGPRHARRLPGPRRALLARPVRRSVPIALPGDRGRQIGSRA